MNYQFLHILLYLTCFLNVSVNTAISMEKDNLPKEKQELDNGKWQTSSYNTIPHFSTTNIIKNISKLPVEIQVKIQEYLNNGCKTFALRQFVGQDHLLSANKQLENAALSPDGTFAIAATNQELLFWNLEDRPIQYDFSKILTTILDKDHKHLITNPANLITLLVIAPNAKIIIIGYDNGNLLCIFLNKDNLTKSTYQVLNNHQATITSLAFSSDSSYFITGSNDCFSYHWHITHDKKIKQRLTSQHAKPLRHIAISPDKSFFVTSTSSRICKIRSVNQPHQPATRIHLQVATLVFNNEISKLSISPDSKFILISMSEGESFLFNQELPVSETNPTKISNQQLFIEDACFHTTKPLALSSSTGGQSYLFDLTNDNFAALRPYKLNSSAKVAFNIDQQNMDSTIDTMLVSGFAKKVTVSDIHNIHDITHLQLPVQHIIKKHKKNKTKLSIFSKIKNITKPKFCMLKYLEMNHNKVLISINDMLVLCDLNIPFSTLQIALLYELLNTKFKNKLLVLLEDPLYRKIFEQFTQEQQELIRNYFEKNKH